MCQPNKEVNKNIEDVVAGHILNVLTNAKEKENGHEK